MHGSHSYASFHDKLNGNCQHTSVMLKSEYDYDHEYHTLILGDFTYPKLPYIGRAICRFDIIGSLDMAAQGTFILENKNNIYKISTPNIPYRIGIECEIISCDDGIIIKCFGNKQKICGYLHMTMICTE